MNHQSESLVCAPSLIVVAALSGEVMSVPAVAYHVLEMGASVMNEFRLLGRRLQVATGFVEPLLPSPLNVAFEFLMMGSNHAKHERVHVDPQLAR